MFKRASNQALLNEVSSYCMIFECDNRWNSAVVIAESYAASALHCVPDRFRANGTPLILRDEQGDSHSVHVHGTNTISDYIVFKKDEGLFKSSPKLIYPQLIDKYLVVGCAFGEKTMSVRVGHVSSVSNSSRGFFYGDGGDLPGYSGGGVFCTRNGFLMGIARGSDYDENDTKQYGDVLEMILAPLIVSHVEFAKHESFSV